MSVKVPKWLRPVQKKFDAYIEAIAAAARAPHVAEVTERLELLERKQQLRENEITAIRAEQVKLKQILDTVCIRVAFSREVELTEQQAKLGSLLDEALLRLNELEAGVDSFGKNLTALKENTESGKPAESKGAWSAIIAINQQLGAVIATVTEKSALIDDVTSNLGRVSAELAALRAAEDARKVPVEKSKRKS